jgi:glycerol-3-phosphate dehydrogenase
MGQSRLAACQRCRLLAAIESDRIHDVSYPVMYPSPTSPLDHLADKEFDVVVVGAGITGACIALDAATRGLRTALIDRADYGSGATANCLRIVHGGLRYLQHLDVRRSRESIVERSMWLRSAPHLVEPLPIVVPTKRGQFPGRWTLGAGLAVNELLSADRNAEIEADRQIPRSRVLSRQECLRLAPDAGQPDISGGILFHDAIMYSPERLTLEVVAAAAIAGATTANYVAFESPRVHDGKVSGCLLRDVLTNDVCEVRTHWIVNATGALAGEICRTLTNGRAQGPQAYSVALNLVTTPDDSGTAFAVSGGPADPDRKLGVGGRQLFVVPWRGQRILGTAHFPFDGDPSAATLPDEYVECFLAELRSATPAINVSRDDVRVVQWGLLPVAGPGAGSRVRLLKHHRIIDHRIADGVGGAISVVSVKFTTARRLAVDVVDRIAGASARALPAAIPLPGKPDRPVADAVRDALSRYTPLLPADVVEHLVRAYGSRHERVIALATEVEGGAERLSPGAPVIVAQLLYGAREEQARTVEDLLWRRCELGPRGLITPDGRRAAERALASATTQRSNRP